LHEHLAQPGPRLILRRRLSKTDTYNDAAADLMRDGVAAQRITTCYPAITAAAACEQPRSASANPSYGAAADGKRTEARSLTGT